MKKIGFRFAVLTVLILFSMYQIIMLWFDNSSNRNFFYNVLEIVSPGGNKSYDEEEAELLRPRTIGVYLGTTSQDFNVIHSTMTEHNQFYMVGMDLIREVLSSGTLSKSTHEKEELWAQRGLFFLYDTDWSKDIIASSLALKRSKLEGSGNISSVVVLPATLDNSSIQVFLVDSYNEIECYTLPSKEVKEDNSKLNRMLDALELMDYPIYLSTMKDEITLFDQNRLLPLRSSKLMFEDEITFTVPFMIDNTILKVDLEQYVNTFFTNPDVKWYSESLGEITYRDSRITIEYNTDGILEYTSIDQGTTSQKSLSEAYLVAEEFLGKDSMLQSQDYYIVDYQIQGTEFTFHYGYTFNTFPLFMEETTLERYDMIAPMSITVSNGEVTKFKRIMLIKEESDVSPRSLNKNFFDTLDHYLTNETFQDGDIEDMYLGYDYEGLKKVSMKWILKTEKKVYTLGID